MIAGALLLSFPHSSSANFCASDTAPAASLLFPFVAIDYDEDPCGVSATTIISITNLSYKVRIVSLTIWSDYGVPVLSFNVLLTGYDVQTIDIRDVLVSGRLPVTKYEDHSRQEGVNPEGPVSGDGSSPAYWIDDLLPAPEPTSAQDLCTTSSHGYPGLYSTAIPQLYLDLFREMLSASQLLDRMYSNSCDIPYDEPEDPQVDDRWFIQRDESSLTWMYITADLVTNCDTHPNPLDLGYWGPTPDESIVAFDNVLTGNVYWRSCAGAAAGNAVHLEADRQFGRVVSTTTEGTPISFYHRLTTLNGVSPDAREPLPTAWALRFRDTPYPYSFPRIRVWKGSTSEPQPPDLEVYPSMDDPFQLRASNCHAYTYYAWDEHENVVSSNTIPSSHGDGANRLPLRTQEVSVEQFYIPSYTGWMLFVWPSSNYPAGTSQPPDYYQTWMGIAEDPWGTHATYADGTVLANWNCFADQELPALGIDYDYVDYRPAGQFPSDDLIQRPVDE